MNAPTWARWVVLAVLLGVLVSAGIGLSRAGAVRAAASEGTAAIIATGSNVLPDVSTGGAQRRYAVINEASNTVVNVIVLEDGANWTPAAGQKIVPADNAEVGGIWDGKAFASAPPPSPDPTEEIRQRFRAAVIASKGVEPWGDILYDFAVLQGLIRVDE